MVDSLEPALQVALTELRRSIAAHPAALVAYSGGVDSALVAAIAAMGTVPAIQLAHSGRKGSRLPRECHMHPHITPRQPSTWELQENGRAFPPNFLHESWRDYLYWDSELES